MDVMMVERGIAGSRSLAQRLIMAGQVRVNGQIAEKPSLKFDNTVKIVLETGPRYISRGGEKLEAGLAAWNLLDLSGLVCVDVGASTGGFTDCLLQHKADRVYAVDVGYGVLHWKLRNDPRVVCMERTNARYIESFPENVNLVTVDASFISLRVLLPVIHLWQSKDGLLIALIKPQFEAGRKDAAKGAGVIRDPEVHRRVIEEVFYEAQKSGYGIKGLIRSPLLGPKGNTEFLTYLSWNESSLSHLDELINQVIGGQ